MRKRTRQNTINYVPSLTPLEVLPPNPRRKAILLSPVAAQSGGGTVLTAAVFNPGAGQTWTVPAGVTTVQDIYAWSGGGDSGTPVDVLGGGGGGGGAFGNSGALTVVPGTIFLIQVGPHGDVQDTTVISPSATTLIDCGSGASGFADVGGAGGTCSVGVFKESGGAGDSATALGGNGAGGGGAGGSFGAGGAGSAGAPGSGGGANTLLGLGLGGTGGNGANGMAGPTPGGEPGAGGGGDVAGGAAVFGAGGLVVVFYLLPVAAIGGISMSHRSDVAVGQGVMNFVPNIVYPMTLTDDEIGDAIGLPWWIIAAVAGGLVQIVEYSYEEDCDV